MTELTRRQFRYLVRLALLHEPSWFMEGASAIGVIGWSCFAFLTDDYAVHGAAWIAPAIGALLGPFRLVTLLLRHSFFRVVAGIAGFAWWSALICGLTQTFGPIPGIGPVIALAVGDFLTVGKFSLVAYVDSWDRDD